MVAVVGGAKVSTKLELLGNLIGRVDTLVIGGGMANTFLAAQGIDVGKSLCEHDLADTAREIMAKAEAAGCAILLPADVVVAREFKAGAAHEIVPANACPPDAMILDAGPAAIAAIAAAFAAARTLVWNGPLGAFEIPPFNAATDAAARQAASLTRAGQAAVGRRRRRHGGGAERQRVGRGLHLRLDRRRRLPRVAGGQDPARGRRARTSLRSQQSHEERR